MTKIGYLKADREIGQGSIKLPEDWNQQSDLWRADVAQDWLYEILDEYNKARQELGWPKVHMISHEPNLTEQDE